jgi:hypothetical protein
MFPTLTRRLATGAQKRIPKPITLTTTTTKKTTTTSIVDLAAPRRHLSASTARSSNTNPHRARKIWPPDFSKLNPQQQLRFEKKYKRRLFNATRAPRWDKAVKYAQLATIAGRYQPAVIAVDELPEPDIN